MRSLCALITVAWLAGCGSSPPTRFYSLDAVKPTGARVADGAITPVKVNAVHVPPLLDRRSMVRHQAGNQLEISSQERWGASFDEMAQSVLTQDLQNRLPPGSIIPPDSPAPPNARGLVVDILSFVPDGSGQIALTCDWSLLEGTPPHPVLSRTVHLSQSASDTPNSQANTMSELLGKLADQIAATVASGPNSAATQH